MAKVTVDGVVYEVDSSNNLLQECLSHGLDLPYFCWHPCMGSVGACRQCAVKQYKNADDKTGVVVMACMTPASDGAIISIKDKQAVNFRSNIIESLMISHPHDCPVCEEGGECHLQDMTQMSGHNYRRYDFKKVTHRNQNLGPFITHEMNRCIACYRCVRFYNDYAGGTDLAVLGSHHHVYFGRHEEGTLENEFSGNLAEVCPTGVFTDKTFSEHYTRKWDLQTAPSICTGCGAGCNITPGERYDTVRRVVNRYHHDLNGYFLCDRGRFAYGYTTSDKRITQPTIVPARVEERSQRKALSASDAARQLDAMVVGDVVGIGSPRASLESNFALRTRVGADNFYAGFSDKQYACIREVIALAREQGLHCPDIRTLEQSDCVVIVSEDITNTSPRHALAIRQSTRNAATQMAKDARIPLWQDAAVRALAQQDRSPLFILSPQGTRLDDVASGTFLSTTSQQIELLNAVADAITGTPAKNSKCDTELVNLIASSLVAAREPTIVSGISAESTDLIHAAANVARALSAQRAINASEEDSSTTVGLCFVMPEVNSMGLGLMLEEGAGDHSLGAAMHRLANGNADAVIVLENDLLLRTTPEAVDAAMIGVPVLIVVDQLHNNFNALAQLQLPAASFAEQNATWVNYEGRAQSSYQVFQPDSVLKPSYQWLSPIDPVAPVAVGSETILQQCSDELPVFAELKSLHALESYLFDTMKAPRQLHRYSGRTAIKADINVHEAKQPVDRQTALAFSMEGIPLQKDSSLLSAAWAPGWNSNQAIGKFQDEINGELRQGCKGLHLLQRSNPARKSKSVVAERDAQKLTLYFIDHIFGGEELSAEASAIRARSVAPYLCIGVAEAKEVGLEQHGLAQVRVGEYEIQLPVLIRQRIAAAAIGIYCGSEISRALLEGELRINPVPGDDNVVIRSRQMFNDLVISDSFNGDPRLGRS